MTAQEKAWKLFLRYLESLPDAVENDKDTTKQCALIAVDEILKASPSAPIEPFGGRINLGECCNLSKAYWQEVRKEIEKL